MQCCAVHLGLPPTPIPLMEPHCVSITPAPLLTREAKDRRHQHPSVPITDTPGETGPSTPPNFRTKEKTLKGCGGEHVR